MRTIIAGSHRRSNFVELTRQLFLAELMGLPRNDQPIARGVGDAATDTIKAMWPQGEHRETGDSKSRADAARTASPFTRNKVR